jgi:hypothetical protein
LPDNPAARGTGPLIHVDDDGSREVTNPIARRPGLVGIRRRSVNIIPDARFGTGLVTRATLATSDPSIQEQQLMVAAAGMPIALPFGRVRIGANVIQPITLGGNLLLPVLIGQGPIQAVEAIEIDNKPLPAGVTVTTYLGAAGQGVDASLVTAWAVVGKTYADTLPGIAWTLLTIPPGGDYSFENIALIVQGLKLYDPRDGTQTAGLTSSYKYSNNPVLALAYFLSEIGVGPEETMDWSSVSTCANIADQTVGTEKRRTIGLYIDQAQDVDQIEQVLRAYAGVWVVREGGTTRFVADAPAASVYDFTKSTYRLDTIEITKRGRAQAPTLVTIKYTDTSASPWKEAEITVKAAGVDAGTTPWIESVVPFQGCQQPGQAYREGVRRLNQFALSDLSVAFIGMDEAAKVMKGDVVRLSDAEGFTLKPVRVVSNVPVEPGRWRITADEYQDAVYSDAVASGPGIPDTSLPDPRTVPAPVAPLTITETVYLEQLLPADSLARGLIYQSRFDLTWTQPSYAYPFVVRIEVWEGGVKRHDGTATAPPYSTPPVQQGKTYTVKLFTRSVALGIESPSPLTGSKMAQGKLLPPGDVPAITKSFEAGGKVILEWTPAIDIDVVRYEWRIFQNGTGTWETATLLDRPDGLSVTFDGLPVGTHRFYVKAIDSVGNYSVNARSVDIIVTSDADAFLQSFEFTSPTLTNMAEIPMIEGVWKRRWATSVGGQTWNASITGTVNSVVMPVIQQHASGTSRWQGEPKDLGFAVTGDFQLTPNVTDINGVATYAIETSLDGVTYTPQPGIFYRGTVRFVRPAMETAGANTMVVTAPPKITLSSQSKPESGIATTLAAGSGGKLIELAGKYSALQDAQATAINTSASRTAVFDRILVHPQSGLMMVDTHAGGGGNEFTYWNIYNANPLGGASVILATDYLQYDVFVDPSSPADSGGQIGGIEFRFSDNTDLRSFTTADADGRAANIGPAISARGAWYTRRISLVNVAGKQISWVALVNENDAGGAYKALVRNVRLTDNAGTPALRGSWIYQTSAEPQNNAVTSSPGATGASNTRVGPANSFLLYAFTTNTAAQVASDAQWSIRGY